MFYKFIGTDDVLSKDTVYLLKFQSDVHLQNIVVEIGESHQRMRLLYDTYFSFRQNWEPAQ